MPYLANFDADIYFRKTVVRKCIFLSFSLLECADNSRNDLEEEKGVGTGEKYWKNPTKGRKITLYSFHISLLVTLNL